MSHNYTLLFHLQVTTRPRLFLELCLVSFEGERSLPFTSRSLSSLVIKGNPSALRKPGLTARGQFGSNWWTSLSWNFMFVAASLTPCRNKSCHFREVVNTDGGSSAALRLCNSFWKRQVGGKYHKVSDCVTLVLLSTITGTTQHCLLHVFEIR